MSKYAVCTRKLRAIAWLPLALVSAVTFADNFTVTATGSAWCHDGTSNTDFPLTGARVQLMDSDCDGSTLCDDVMNSIPAYVTDDGSFSVQGSGGDPGNYSWSRPDVYIRIVFNDDQGVRLTDELDRDQYFDTPEHDHDNTADGSTVAFGGWTTGANVSGPSATSLGDGTKCAVWKKAHDAYHDAIKILGATPPAGHYDVEYWSGIYAGTPWTNTDTTHWPIHSPTDASVHEFAHTIRHAADGDGGHFSWDVTRFRYARNHARCDPNSNRIGTDTISMDHAFGFNEGWAEFWEGKTKGCWAVSIDDALEGNVAFALNVLSGVPSGGRKRMVETLIKHPGEIHNLDEFMTFYSQEVGQARERLTAIMASVPKPNVTPARLAEFAPVTLDRQRQAVEAEIQLLSTRPMAHAAEARAVQTPTPRDHRAERVVPRDVSGPCGAQECEVAFKSAIAPAIANAEAQLRALEVSRLRSSLETESIESMMKREQDGTLERYLANLRSRDAEARVAILNKAFADAIAAASRLDAQSAEIRALTADLTEKQAHLRALQASRSRLPPELAGHVLLPEDAPIAR
jgi:hypothetical protein